MGARTEAGTRVARMRAIGADGCRGGWVVAAGDVDPRGSLGTVTIAVVPEFAPVAAMRADRIVVDMPIGMPESWAPGGRGCDVEARALLGPGRGSSVFPGPPRPALDLVSFDDPRRVDLGLTLQSWLILPRIREIDEVITPEQQDPAGKARPVILEGHPELIFADLAGGNPIEGSKRSAEGRLRRRVLLEEAFGRPIPVVIPQGADEDDVLDALACLWVAAAPRSALSAVPRRFVPRDARGLAMRNWRRAAAGAPPERQATEEAKLINRLVEALGPAPDVQIRRRTGEGARGHGVTLDTEGARAVVELDRSAGLDRLARHWAELRDSSDERPFLLVHLVRTKTGSIGSGRAKDWEFLAARMADDLARIGRKRPGAWDAIRLEWGPDAAADPVMPAVERLRRAFRLDSPG